MAPWPTRLVTSIAPPSPAGNQIAFIQTRSGKTEQWLIQDGRWLYYSALHEGNYCIDKVPANGGQPVVVRCGNAFAPAVAPDGSALYFASPVKRDRWIQDWEVRSASPESAPSRVLAQMAGPRIPVEPLNIQTILAPDGRSLAIPLTDRGESRAGYRGHRMPNTSTPP